MLRYTDAQAKEDLRKWPIVSQKLFGPEIWLRNLPFPLPHEPGLPSLPYLYRVGDRSKTYPDGLYARFGAGYADVIAIEHCGTQQNLNDKRSRYAASRAVNILALPKEWYSQWEVLVCSGRTTKYRTMRSLIYKHGFKGQQWMGPRPGGTTSMKDWKVPIRKLRVVYATPFEPRQSLDAHELHVGEDQLAKIIEVKGAAMLAVRKKLYTLR
jgi:hypothetical protein